MKEATTLTFAPWKERVEWVRKKVREFPDELDSLTNVVRRMGWDFNVDYIAGQIAKAKRVVEKCNAIASTPMMTIAELKTRFPIKSYCEEILLFRFKEDNHCKCPLHITDSKNLQFAIDPERGIFAVEVRPTQLKLLLVPSDRNSQRERFRILGCDNTPENWERMTSAVLRIGQWKPSERFEKALTKPIELGDLLIVA
jgi:hypothetical protein